MQRSPLTKSQTLLFDWIQNLPSNNINTEYKDHERIHSTVKQDKVMQHAIHAIDIIASLYEIYGKFPSTEIGGTVSDIVASARDVLEDSMDSLSRLLDQFKNNEIFDIEEEYEKRCKEAFVPDYLFVQDPRELLDISVIMTIIINSYLEEIDEIVAMIVQVTKKFESKANSVKSFVRENFKYLDSSITFRDQLKYQILKSKHVKKSENNVESVENHQCGNLFITKSSDSTKTKRSVEQIFPNDLFRAQMTNIDYK